MQKKYSEIVTYIVSILSDTINKIIGYNKNNKPNLEG